ncbi:MAG: MoxR family ATPase [Acidobacteriota bacterium]
MSDVAASRFQEAWQRIRQEIGKVIVGNQEVVDGVLTCFFAGGHALLEGLPGLGKTLLVKTLADSLHARFARIQFTPDLMPTDITGTMIVAEEDGRRELRFQHGPVFTNVLLADEINRATPKTQSALLEAMAEASVTVGGTRHQLPDPFLVLGTQNPIEMEGTYPLPEAQLDRFFLKLLVPFPDLAELGSIVDRTTGVEEAHASRVIEASEVRELRRLVREVPVAAPVKEYALRIVLGLHPESALAHDATKKSVRYGPSPRGAQALMLASKLRALSLGRAHVAFEDVRFAVLPALRHRVLLSFEGEASGVTADGVIGEVVKGTRELSLDAEREAVARA